MNGVESLQITVVLSDTKLESFIGIIPLVEWFPGVVLEKHFQSRISGCNFKVVSLISHFDLKVRNDAE
jgi:hypothetical protein